MRYEDASQTGSGQVDARNDADHLAARDYGPATGNVISGTGTITGSTGVDMVGSSAGRITSIDGAGGSDSSFSAGKLSVHGQYGTLSIDARGNYSYEREPGTPAGVSDTFHYTLANKAGATDTARLVINIGDLPKLATDGTRVVPGPDGVVTLPPGVELSDIRIVGRDLVVTLPDGSTMIIVDGAIFVPQLVLGGVEVPASNLAALLIGSEPSPAAGDLAGNTPSSGGNFEVPVAPLDPGVPLGDLLPPTELNYTPPEFHEIGQVIEKNDPPLIGFSAVNVSEEGLANGIPDTVGTPDTTNLPTANGVILVSDPNGDPLTVTMGAPGTSLTSAGVAIVWTISPDGHLVTGTAGGNTVITISINDAGAYTVNLLRPVDHPTGGGEQGTDIVIPVSVSDGDIVTTGGTITVTIEDDSPTVTGRFQEPTLVVDESVLGTNDTQSFAGAFTVNYGADGPAAANSLAYALGINAGATGLTDTATGNAVVLSLESGVVIGRAGAGGAIVFSVTVDGSGNVTLDQQRAVVHTTSSNLDTSEGAGLSADNLITLNLVATDKDGDSATASINIGQNLTFNDDGPSAGVTTVTEPILTVDDSTLGTNASASFAGLFSTGYGADNAGTTAYSLTATVGASGLVDVATNEAVNLSINGSGQVEGRTAIGGVLVFTVTVDSAGLVTLDQIRAIKHSPDTGPDQSTSLTADGLIGLKVTITDKDGDSATASVNIGSNLVFKDDAPAPFTPDSVAALNGNSAAVTGIALNTNLGSDSLGSIVFDIVNNVMAQDLAGNNLTLGGQQLFLFGDGTGTITASTGLNGTGTIGFTVTINQANGTYSFDVNGVISNGTETVFSDFTSLKSGNFDTVALGADNGGNNAGNIDVLFSARGGSVNVSTQGIGVGNQSVGSGEAVRIDLMNNITTDAGQPTGFNYGGHYETTHFEQLVSQTQSGDPVNIRVTAVLADDDQNIPNTTANMIADGELLQTITKVYVDLAGTGGALNEQSLDISALSVGSTTAVGTTGVSVTKNADGSVTFNGLNAGDQYGFDTLTDFNTILVEHPGDQPKSFDILSFSVGSATTGSTIDQNFTVVATDADGDFVTSTLATTIVPVSADNQVGTAAADPLTGNANDNVLAGNNGGDTISGLGGNDTLLGGGGDDTLSGGIGNDTLVGNGGVDTLNGGTGNDVFVLSNAAITAGQADIIQDYAAGDIVDITQILNVPGVVDPIAGGYLRVTTTGLVQVDLNGGNNSWVTVSSINTGVSPVAVRYIDGGTVTTVNVTPVAPPVVLDLDGDGVEFLSLASGTVFGGLQTAWVGADDGILVRDANGNGLVDNASEFVFATTGTDLEALHAQYGEQLDASDADFVMFAVWNDANSNGIADAGELTSLTDAGIASISLVSDGQSYSAANGDVQVAGSTSFTRTDGSTGAAADATFATGYRSTMESERVAANSNNVVLAAALAAAGLAISAPAAAAVADGNVGTGRFAHATGSVEAFDLSILGLSTDTAMPALMGDFREGFSMPTFAPASSFSTEPMAGSIGDLISSHGEMMAPTALLAGSDMLAGQMAMPMMASNVAMPGSDALVAMAGLNNSQSAVTVESIVADALQGGGTGLDINALLNALPGQGIGANVGTETMASLGNGLVPSWDTGHGGGFTFAATNAITSEALALHHDAIQPISNG